MARPKLSESAAEALRAKMRGSKLALREIARRADVDVGLVSRFLARKRDVLLFTAEKLADAVGARLRVARKLKPRGTRSRKG